MINIIPYTQKKIVHRIRHIRIAVVVIVGAILLMAIAILLFLPTLHTIDTRFKLANDQMQRLEERGVIAKKADVADLKLRTKIVTDKLAAPSTPAPLYYVQEIRKHEKDGIRLTGFLVKDTSTAVLEITGIANTRQSLQKFVNVLQAEPSIALVDSPVANFIKNNQSQFTITVTFKKI